MEILGFDKIRGLSKFYQIVFEKIFNNISSVSLITKKER